MKKFFTYAFVFLLSVTCLAFAKTNELKGYVGYFGTIEDVNKDGKYSEILVKNEDTEDKGMEKLYLYTEGVPVVDLKTGELVKDYKFKKNEKIQYFFRKDTPVLQSYPAKLTPGFIGVNVEKAKDSLEVDTFDKNGRGASERLVVDFSDKSFGINMKGEKVKDLKDKDLAVLYTVATASLPPITNPDKIFVIDTVKSVDMEDFKVEGKGYYLRSYYEALDADVNWDKDTKCTKISLNDKFIEIDNTKSVLKINGKETSMKDFKVEKGVSYIGEEYIKMIDDYLMK